MTKLSMTISCSARSHDRVFAQTARRSSGQTASATAMTDAEVRKVDKDAAKITLKHGELKNLEMPAMTMVFQVKDKSMLDQVKAGDKVRFAADKVGGAFVDHADRGGEVAGYCLLQASTVTGSGLRFRNAASGNPAPRHQQPRRRNHEHRQQRRGDHAADHRRGDALHDLRSRAVAPHDRKQAREDHRDGHRLGPHAQHRAFLDRLDQRCSRRRLSGIEPPAPRAASDRSA